jgi:hypothetical protein
MQYCASFARKGYYAALDLLPDGDGWLLLMPLKTWVLEFGICYCGLRTFELNPEPRQVDSLLKPKQYVNPFSF